MTDSITLMPGCVKLDDLKKIIAAHKTIKIDKQALSKINASHQTVKAILAEKKTVYGINTGFGSLAHHRIPEHSLEQLQKNIVLSHACGTGQLLEDDIVALILLLKINTLAQGYSGVSMNLIDTLLQLFNHAIYPCIPGKGSVGASGDLVPLAHMALPLIGEGEVRYHGQLISAKEGFAHANLKCLTLGPKEGLALLNGLQVSAALAIHAYFLTETLFKTAIVAGSLSVEAARASHVPFDNRVHQVRQQKAQSEVAGWYRQFLQDSAIHQSHKECSRVQDPYSLRCQPQIMGAIWHQMGFVRDTLQTEANAVTDNPLVFESGDILSGGNFHGEIIAMAADNLALAIAEIGANAERRIALLIDKNFSGLPAFLVRNEGVNSGFMIAHVTSAACASDNKALAHPYCVDSIPTSANQEDHVSMATSAARRLQEMLDNTASILAIELLAACQGLSFHEPLTPSSALQAMVAKVRGYVEPYEEDRYFAPDIAIIKARILAGEFSQWLKTHS